MFVPNERIFLDGDTEAAGTLALTFVEYHRFTAVSYKLPLVDALGGCAALAADYNGIIGAGHVREKFVDLIAYAETTRALLEKSADRCIDKPNNQVAPDPMTVNLAKSYFAHGYHEAVQHVQEIAGGILVTGPGDEDWEHEELRPFLQKYLAGRDGVDGERRMRLLNFVRDLTSLRLRRVPGGARDPRRRLAAGRAPTGLPRLQRERRRPPRHASGRSHGRPLQISHRSPQMPRLPLFPLQIVVFPGEEVPLHIFEPRYRQLVRDMNDAGEPFGIALLRRGAQAEETHEIGCTVRIEQTEPFPDGRFNIMCRGEQRFRIIQRLDAAPYWIADVEFLDDPGDSDSGRRLRRLHRDGGALPPASAHGAGATELLATPLPPARRGRFG